MAISITEKTATANTTKASGRSIKYIVIHYTAGTSSASGAAANTAAYFAKTTTKASADFIVDDSTIVQYNPDIANRYCWHCGGSKLSGSKGGSLYKTVTNKNSIGVEICSTNSTGTVKDANDSTWSFTSKALSKAKSLVKYLMEEYGIDSDHVIRHYDVNGKLCLPIDSTELLTKDGWIPLGDISIGDEVAQYHPDTDTIDFAGVLDKITPYDAEVLLNRGVEATVDHRMYLRPNCKNSMAFREIPWGEAISGHKQFVIKNGAVYHGEGLDLTDDELSFLVWVQGDGHYMKEGDCFYGIEFHLSKRRKIAALVALIDSLGYPCKVNEKENETISLRIYGKQYVEWCEKWLKDKCFRWNLLDMTREQFEVFWGELLKVDGCQNADLYTSSVEENLDIVQAVCATKGVRTCKSRLGSKLYNYCAIIRAKSNYTVGREELTSRRVTSVSCVTVPSGYILIRQRAKTFIVGNCPGIVGWNVDSGDESDWTAFKKSLTSSSSSSSSSSTTTTSSSSTSSSSMTNADCPFKVKVSISNLNIRKGAGTNYAKTGKYTGVGTFTITKVKSGTGSTLGWGKLKSGAGWISLDYCKRVS